MKRLLILSAVILALTLTLASAANLEVNKTEREAAILSELKNPAIFDFTIDNKGAPDKFEIYSLVGASFEPKGWFNLSNGITKMEVRVYPSETARKRGGNYAFQYEIRGENSGIVEDMLTVKIVKFDEIFDIVTRSIKYGDKNAVVTIKNNQNMNIDNVTLTLKSIFFGEKERVISLKPFESMNITLPVKNEEIKDLGAGTYLVTAYFELDDAKTKIEKAVIYLEKENIAVSKVSEGWIIRTTEITKINEGNTEAIDTTEVTKNMLTRLFTTFSVEPLSTERRGVFVHYRWERELKPSESWSVKITTNYTLPFVLALLVILSAFFVYIYSRTAVVLSKRVYHVKTKGGEFALKVMLHVKARSSVDNIEIYDRIPGAMKLFDKAGMPHKIDGMGRLTWKIDRLNAGEDRIFSYIIYSPIRIVGRLELSPATAHFAKGGKSSYVSSNRTYFMSEIHPRF